MSQPQKLFTASFQTHIFPADALNVIAGVNISEPLGAPDENCLGDSFVFDPRRGSQSVSIHTGTGNARVLRAGKDQQYIATGSETGTAGDALILLARLQLMAQDGEQVDILLLSLGMDGLYFLPLLPLDAEQPYSLIETETHLDAVRIAEITPIAFARGTRITLGGGRQCAVEDLKPGDDVLSRDGGTVPVRWIGSRTLRAVGTYAPVVITKGTLSNAHDLIVGQYQRLFLYESDLPQLSDQSDMFVRARDLVDNDNIYIRKGGFVDYFHVLLDSHEVIYAECIPTESLLLDANAMAMLPDNLANDLEAHLPPDPVKPYPGHHLDRKTVRALGPSNLHRRRDKL